MDADTGHSEKHLQEAQELTIFGEEDAQIELQLGHVCNNRCVFCVSGQLTEQKLAKQIDPFPVFKAINDGADRGVKRLTFLGGEPTTQRSFMPALKLAVDRGYEEIVIFTNGIRTRKPEFIDKIVALGGRYEWRFSLQGATEESHDAVTKRPGSYARLVQGMEYVASLGEDVTINMCVNRYSYEAMPHYLELLQRYKVRQLHIDQVRPSDSGRRTDEYFREIIPPYSEMAPYFGRMLERIHEWDPDYDVNLGNYPYCQLPKWAHKIHHDGQKTFTYPADGFGNFCEPFDKYPTKRFDKFYPDGCTGCVFKEQCNGVFHKYAELYGTDEFQAVTLEDLDALDEDWHFFVLRVDPQLAPLRENKPPEPWKPVEFFRNTRDRVFEIRYVDASERRATVVLTPPDGKGQAIEVHPPIIKTSHYNASLLLDPGLALDEVVNLVQWVEGCLVADPAVTLVEPADLARLAWGLMSPERLRKARGRLARLTHRLRERHTFGSWTYAGQEALADGHGASVRIEGPKGETLKVVFEIQPDPNRPLVGLRYELPDDTAADTARPVVRSMMEALRG